MTSITISETLKQIPSQKEALKKSFENLQLHYPTFTLQWKDLEDHFSAIESSIQLRFNSFQNQTKQTQPKQTQPSGPDPKLKSICANMDHRSLRDHIFDISVTPQVLATALALAPDPASLVLEAVRGFDPFDSSRRWDKSKRRRMENGSGDVELVRKNYIRLLEGLYLIGGDFKEKIDGVKQKAKEVAVEWKAKKIERTVDNALRIMGFLLLVVTYGLVREFEVDEVMDLFLFVCRRKQAVELIKPLGLEDKGDVIVEKLSSLGRQVDAVKIVYALNLVDKYPPVPLLKACVNEAKNKAHEMRKKGEHSWQAMNEAAAKEIAVLKSVRVAIEEYKLDNEYPRDEILKRIAQLEEQRKAKTKQAAATALASTSKKRTVSNSREKKHQQPNKRARSPAVAANHYYPSLMVQSQPHVVVDERAWAPYMAVPGPYGAAPGHPAASMYSPIRGQGGSSLSGVQLGGPGLGGPPPPRPYYHSVESLAGAAVLPRPVYERPVAYHGYDGMSDRRPPPYGSSLYR